MSARGRRANPYKRPDAFTRAAKARGFPARSVFKLEEIDRRVRLFRLGQRVLDLGAAPGSWAMYAAGKVGGRGKVLAVDLAPITTPMPAQVEVVQGDALAQDLDVYGARGPFDVVLSDWYMPHGSGADLYAWLESNKPEIMARCFFMSGGVGSYPIASLPPGCQILPKGQDSNALIQTLLEAVQNARAGRAE